MNKILFFFVTIAFSAQMLAQDSPISKVESAFSVANYTLCLQESLSGIESSGEDSASLALLYAYAGLSSEELSSASDAIVYYRQSIDYKVPRLDIYTKMMILTKAQADHENYEYVLACQAREFPDFAEDVLIKLNSHYYKTKQYEQLENNATKFLALWPDDVKSNFYLAYANEKQGNISEAKALYKKVIALDGNHKSSNIALGVILYKEGVVVCKKETSKYELINKPTRVDYHDYMQRLDVGKTDFREALPFLLKGYELKPSDNLKSLIKNCYMRIGETEKADQY